MSLLFESGSMQRVICPYDATYDDLATWSVFGWVYPTDVHPADRRDFFKKAHAKRFGIDGSAQTATTGYMTLKQNYSSGLIQYGGQVFTAANKWWFIAGVVTTSRGYIYVGDEDTVVAEISSYTETIATQVGGVETDANDPTYGMKGTPIFGNENGRFNFQRGFPGYIATGAFVSAEMTLAELKRQQFSLWPAVQHANLEFYYQFGYTGQGQQRDYSGNGRHAYTAGMPN